MAKKIYNNPRVPISPNIDSDLLERFDNYVGHGKRNAALHEAMENHISDSDEKKEGISALDAFKIELCDRYCSHYGIAMVSGEIINLRKNTLMLDSTKEMHLSTLEFLRSET